MKSTHRLIAGLLIAPLFCATMPAPAFALRSAGLEENAALPDVAQQLNVPPEAIRTHHAGLEGNPVAGASAGNPQKKIADVTRIEAGTGYPGSGEKELRESVEAPWLPAAIDLYRKNIETMVSSANGHDLREEARDGDGRFWAYLTIDFKTLSAENQRTARAMGRGEMSFGGARFKILTGEGGYYEIFQIDIPITRETTVLEFVAQAKRITDHFVWQKRRWDTGWMLEELRERYGIMYPELATASREYFEQEKHYYYDPATDKFYASQEHCAKVNESAGALSGSPTGLEERVTVLTADGRDPFPAPAVGERLTVMDPLTIFYTPDKLGAKVLGMVEEASESLRAARPVQFTRFVPDDDTHPQPRPHDVVVYPAGQALANETALRERGVVVIPVTATMMWAQLLQAFLTQRLGQEQLAGQILRTELRDGVLGLWTQA